jgi:methyl-accepting chemotaxis protein
LGVYLLHFTAVLVIVFSAFVLVFTRQLEHSSLSAVQQQEVAGRIMWFYGHMWPFMWGVFMLLVIHSIYVTHKIAGPLYRIKNVLWSVGSGDLTRKVTIRDRDYLSEEAKAVNDVIDIFRKKIEGSQVLSSSASTALAGLSRAIEQGTPDETAQRLEEATSQLEKLRTSLGYFTVATRPNGPTSEVPREATVEDLTPVG